MPNWTPYRNDVDPFPEPVLQGPTYGLTFPWVFLTKDGHTANWGGAGQRVVERMMIFMEDYTSSNAQTQLCGYAIDNEGGFSGIFNRFLPWQHPIFDWLYIDREHGINDVKYIGQPATFPKAEAYPSFPYAILTLVFTERPYSVTNGTPQTNQGLSGQPFLQQLSQGSSEFIQLSTGQYQFDPTDLGVQAVGLQRTVFDSGMALPYQKNTLAWKWYDVPHYWAFDTNGIESSILACLGTVNAQACFGYPPGTLYFESYAKERKSYPIPPIGGDIKTTWSWDFTLIMKYRNPPLWPIGQQAIETGLPNKQGHNVAPMPRASPSGFWFPIVSVPLGTNSGNNAAAPQVAWANAVPGSGGSPRFQSTNFGQIFTQAAAVGGEE